MLEPFSSTRQRARAPALRLVLGDVDRQLAPSELPPLISAQLNRPGERHEGIEVERDQLDTIGTTARELRLPVEVCARLTIERHLAVRQITEAVGSATAPERGRTYVDHLNQVAAAARADCELTPPTAAYAQMLLFGTATALSGSIGDRVRVSLPMRLLAIVDADIVRKALDEGDVAAARNWEIAALLNGQSLSEWAALIALTFATDG